MVALALAATIGLALVLRLYGLDWDRGYAFTPHPDERSILMRVGEMGAPSIATFFDADASPWNPRRFDYGSVPFYLLKTAQLLYSALPLDDLRDLRFTGRALSGLADVGTVALVYLLGSRMYGRERGAAGRRAGCHGGYPHPAKPLLRLRRTARAVLRRGALRDARRVQDGQPKTLGARRPARWPWYGHQGQPSTYIPGIRSSARDVRVWRGSSEGRERGGTGRERVPGTGCG